ncbi:MAG TPA: choice-of-anchor P family protein [Steroidobacteraceae bacterium]|nr:choice-of-anchor P family protein [Steroidobacteraceae bacterium]
MHRTVSLGRCFMAVALATILLTSPAAGFAQLGGLLPSPPAATSSTVVGDASAARVSVLGILGTAMTTALADTGTLTTANNALDASMLAGGIPSALSAETLSASTISWADQVDSEASLGNLSMTVAGVGITADFVMAEATQVLGAAGSGSSTLTNLVINGTPIAVTGAPNQAVWIPGGQVILNEQTISSTGAAVVNALHVVVTGVADVVVASATAGVS